MPTSSTRAVVQSIEVVRRRIDSLGTREPSITRQGADRMSKAKLAEDVRAHGRRLKELYADAVAEGRDAELAFLKEERAAVEALLLSVEG